MTTYYIILDSGHKHTIQYKQDLKALVKYILSNPALMISERHAVFTKHIARVGTHDGKEGDLI